MTDHYTTTDQTNAGGSDSAAGTRGATKPTDTANQSTERAVGAESSGKSSGLLDGSLDPAYQQMMIASSKAAGAQSGGSGARANLDLQNKASPG